MLWAVAALLEAALVSTVVASAGFPGMLPELGLPEHHICYDDTCSFRPGCVVLTGILTSIA